MPGTKNKSKTTKRKIIPWPEILASYRTGVFSNRQLAIKYAIAESTLRAKAKRDNWSKDLAQQVASSVNDKLTRLVGDEVLSLDDDSEIVEKASNEKVSVLKGHRSTLTRLHGVIGQLTQRLENQLERDQLSVQIKDQVVEIDIPLDYVGKVVGQLSKSAKDLIELERKTYGLDDEQESKMSYEETIIKLAEEFENAERNQ